MNDNDSLLLRAKRLAAVARAKRDNAADIQAAGQFATALNKLAGYFPELQTQLTNRSALAKTGASCLIRQTFEGSGKFRAAHRRYRAASPAVLD